MKVLDHFTGCWTSQQFTPCPGTSLLTKWFSNKHLVILSMCTKITLMSFGFMSLKNLYFCSIIFLNIHQKKHCIYKMCCFMAIIKITYNIAIQFSVILMLYWNKIPAFVIISYTIMWNIILGSEVTWVMSYNSFLISHLYIKVSYQPILYGWRVCVEARRIQMNVLKCTWREL